MFGNPHQSPEEMEQDKHFTSNSFIVAYSEEGECQKLDVNEDNLSNMFFVNIQADIMKLKQQVWETDTKIRIRCHPERGAEEAPAGAE